MRRLLRYAKDVRLEIGGNGTMLRRRVVAEAARRGGREDELRFVPAHMRVESGSKSLGRAGQG